MYAHGWTPCYGDMTPSKMRRGGLLLTDEHFHYGSSPGLHPDPQYIALDELYSDQDVVTACERALKELGEQEDVGPYPT